MNGYTPKKRKAGWFDYSTVVVTAFLLLMRFKYGAELSWLWVFAPLIIYFSIYSVLAYREMNKAIDESIKVQENKE